ncbi:MAG: response regulator transcription factor, partial [Actinobacteria bacterium]
RPSPEAAAPPAIRRQLGVVLVDPLPVVRAGISLLVDGRPDMEILAEAGDGKEGVDAISRVRRSRVVVLVGLGLEGEHDAAWLIRTVRERFPSHAVLAMGANADPTMISRALFVGADGYVESARSPTASSSAATSTFASPVASAKCWRSRPKASRPGRSRPGWASASGP